MKTESGIITFFKHKKIEVVVLFYILVLLVTGLTMQSLDELGLGLIKIFTSPAMLITDYMEVGGMGPTFVNGGLVGLIAFIILILNKVSFRGITIAAIFTLVGFAFMGKNVWSILPIIFGVFIYCKLTKREFVSNIYPAFFGTALAPFVTTVAYEFGWGIPGGIIVGILIGIVIPPIASHVLVFHEGYNLYNVGFTAGFIGLIFINIFRAFGYDSQSVLIWGTKLDNFLRPYMIVYFSSMILLGIILGKDRLKDFSLILKHPGTLITDFTTIAGFGNTLINMGIVGLIGVIYIILVKGNFNGATLCGLLTMVGFAAFGKHPLNVTPIMAGIFIGTLFSKYEANAPGQLIAALFGTALAPVAGQFGPLVGILAGMVHLSVVSTIGVVHGALNLYNNGFTAGFVAAFFVAISKGIKKD